MGPFRKRVPESVPDRRAGSTMNRLIERSGYEIEDLWGYLKHLTCPTLVVRGKESEFLSLSEVRKMCGIIPNATWREIPDTTHMPAQENPANFNQTVDDFLTKIEHGNTRPD